MQTFQRDWWYTFKFPHHFPCYVTAAGEFHARHHVQHADKRLNEAHIYMPFFVYFGAKGMTGPKLIMKKQSKMERWPFIFLSGVIMWLRRVFTEEQVKALPTLLNKVRRNKPVYNLVGWAYYHACFVWGDKRAVRVGDFDRLDFMWRYSLMMYSRTNKNTYKKGYLQNLKILLDCEPNVRKILTRWRTYSEHGFPCSGGELDLMEERVSHLMHVSALIKALTG